MGRHEMRWHQSRLLGVVRCAPDSWAAVSRKRGFPCFPWHRQSGRATGQIHQLGAGRKQSHRESHPMLTETDRHSIRPSTNRFRGEDSTVARYTHRSSPSLAASSSAPAPSLCPPPYLAVPDSVFGPQSGGFLAASWPRPVGRQPEGPGLWQPATGAIRVSSRRKGSAWRGVVKA